MRDIRSILSACCLMFVASLLGCSTPTEEAGEAPPPVVTVKCPLEREVIDYGQFTGRLAPVETTFVRARVSGYLDRIDFKDGQLVTEKQVLFEIDPRLYQAALDQAEGTVAQLKARVVRQQADYERAQTTFTKGAMSREEFEKYFGDMRESRSALDSATGALAMARLNVGFTKVLAPATGRIGQRMVDRGNLIRADDTILARIVTEDRIYCNFDVDDLTYQQVRDRVRAGSAKGNDARVSGSQEAKGTLSVEVGLVDETGFPHRGTVDFVDNQLEAGTGTMRMRGIFRNDDRSLTPGLFARVRLPVKDPHKALLIEDRAIDTDQGKKVVYVVSSDDMIEKREVQLGGLHEGLREISSGVGPRDRIVVDGIQRVRPGIKVVPNS